MSTFDFVPSYTSVDSAQDDSEGEEADVQEILEDAVDCFQVFYCKEK